MSIYATVLAFTGDAEERPAPIVYQGSHVLPDDTDERGGDLLVCEIPGFISRRDRVLCGNDAACGKPADLCCDRAWPWLRWSVRDAAKRGACATVVTDREQVATIHAYLGDWLERSAPEGGCDGER